MYMIIGIDFHTYAIIIMHDKTFEGILEYQNVLTS